MHEVLSGFGVTPADQVGHDQLGVGVNRGPGPSVAGIGGSGLGGLERRPLAVVERPDFVTLDPAGL